MTSLSINMESGRRDPFSDGRGRLADRRRGFLKTLNQVGVVAVVFALGAAFHVMKWTGLLVL